MAALRKLAAAATTSALLAAPRARAEEAAPDEAQAAELRAKLLALAAAQRERTDWEARRLHQLMRAVDEEHSRERAAMLEKAAAEDAQAFAEERARTAEQRAKSDEAAAVRERAEARADVRRLLTEYDDALAAVWRGKVQEAEGAAHSKARETLLAEIEAAADERDDAPRLQTVFERRPSHAVDAMSNAFRAGPGTHARTGSVHVEDRHEDEPRRALRRGAGDGARRAAVRCRSGGRPARRGALRFIGGGCR